MPNLKTDSVKERSLLWDKFYSHLNSFRFLKPLLLKVKDRHHSRTLSSKCRFYSTFLKPGDLCFDIGANVGNRIDAFLMLGCKVVAAEPQTQCFEYLNRKYARNKNVTLIKKGLAESEGTRELHICAADAISSMSPEWISAVKQGRYKNFRWNSEEKVETITLDSLIKLRGLPRFCKIDVEGFELNVIKGLSHRIPVISFEFTPERKLTAKQCIAHLTKLGKVTFNYSEGELMQFSFREWRSPKAMLSHLENIKLPPGDIYARFR